MLKGLIEAYVKALVESDLELQQEFAALAGGAVQGVTAPLGMGANIPSEPYVPPFRRGKKRKKK